MKRSFFLYLLSVILMVGLFSCSATKYVAEDEYLLRGYKIDAENGDYDKRDLKNYIKQKPNKRIIFWKFYLSLYNVSKPGKDNGWHNYWRRIGEPPVIYDDFLKRKTTDQLELYMRNRGFYEADISDTTIYNEKRKRARVVYTVKPHSPYRIRSIDYFFEDATLSHMVLADTTSNDFRSGERFDMDAIEDESKRIETILRDSGYYAFKRKNFVYFKVDSALNSHQADVMLGIHNFPDRDGLGNSIHTDHPLYRIRNVDLTSDFESYTSGSSSADASRSSMVYDSIKLNYKGEKINVRPGLLTQKNYIIPGDLFDAADVNRTYRNLSSLSAYNMVDISFEEVQEEGERMLDCNIRAVPATRQSYRILLEGTNSAGNLGAAANVSYRHRNLFGGSEQFDLSFLGAIENIKNTEESDSIYSGLNIMQEFGVEARLRIPRFLLPFKTEQFIRKYNPQTNIRLSFNYQKRPDYIRTLANASFGYEWKASEKLIHRIYPFEMSLIRTPYKSDYFQDWLEGKYLFYSYEPHFILNQRYSLTWSNQKVLKQQQNFQDVRFNVETAGNLLYLGNTVFAPDPEGNPYQLMGIDFAQYLKADVDLRSYHILYEGISLVFRGYAGVGYAYMNSTAMPFEKQYFSGGANSIRAWQVKDLGPGSYEDPEETPFPNQTGDVKLEANIEYRFLLFWKLEAALFLDAGNIWSLSAEDDRVGAGFEFNRFYKEIAVGTGVGARVVFPFFVFRFDMGIPLRSPYAISGANWLPRNSGVSGSDLVFHFAIGYPF